MCQYSMYGMMLIKGPTRKRLSAAIDIVIKLKRIIGKYKGATRSHVEK